MVEQITGGDGEICRFITPHSGLSFICIHSAAVAPAKYNENPL